MKAKSQVSLYASWGHLILKMHHSTTRQAKQKISTNHDHHWSKKCSFLYVQTNCVCPSETQRFCKNDSDSSHRLWLVSNRVILCKTWLESSHHFSQRDSSRVRVTKSRDSSRVIDSSHAITANKRNLLHKTISIYIYCWCVEDVSFQSPLIGSAYIPTQSLKGPHFEVWTGPELETPQTQHSFLKHDFGTNAIFFEGVKITAE